jgi:glutamine amidotransferase
MNAKQALFHQPKVVYKIMSIAIIDYGMGNVRSVQKAIEYVAPNEQVFLTNNAKLINEADRVVFPGQGAMGACMHALNEYGLVDVIKRSALEKPFLGICLGLQLLFEHSQENNGTDGLSIINGNVIKFKTSNLKIPHMGWNTVKQSINHPLWHNIEDNARFYSVHSYYVAESNSSVVAGKTNYGVDFTCAIAQDNMFAVQFHPEKSQHDGLQLLTNFVNWKV